MLTALIDWSLKNRFVVLLGAACFVALGLYSLEQLNIDAFPDTTPVQVQINTNVSGLGPEEVESQITMPIEQSIGGLSGLEQIRSTSKFGLSQVVATFRDGTDIYFARQQLNERLNSAALPEGMPRPTLGPVATGLGEVFHYLITSDDLMKARTAQDWVIRPALRKVPGTAEINSWGGLEKQFQVLVDPDRLLRFDIAYPQLIQALHDNNLNVGGGYLDHGGEMLIVQGMGRTASLDDIRSVPIVKREQGVPITIGHVAEVSIGAAPRIGGVSANGLGEAVLGLGFLTMNENGHAVTRQLQKKLTEAKQNLPPDVKVQTVYERTYLVDQVIDTVRKNLFEGGLLVVAVLFIFLGSLRAGLVVAMAIPLSVLFAFFGMYRFGIAASLLSLGALDFGLVVDSSVVLVENVIRRLALQGKDGRSRQEVIRDAVVEVRGPTMFGELIIMIVYLPILTLEGVEGKLFRPMALTVIFALVGSMILSMTVMPVLASLLLPRVVHEDDPWLVRLARWIYRPILHWALKQRLAVLGFAGFLFLGAMVMALNLGREFVPRLSEGALVCGILRLPGTDLSESLRINTRMEKLLLEKFPNEVKDVWSRCGTAEVATDPMGPEETDMFITLHPRERWRAEIQSQEKLAAMIEEEFAEFPGQRLSISQPIEQRINEMISGVRSEVAIKLFGDDFKILTEKAEDLEKILTSIDGSSDVAVELLTGQPMLKIRVLQAQIKRYGISARHVLELVETLNGRQVGEMIEGQYRFPLTVRLNEKVRANQESIGRILVTAPSGEKLPLSRLTTIDVLEGPAKIMREAGQRRIVVQCKVQNRDLGSFIDEARRKVSADFVLPPGRYHIEWGGQFENLQRGLLRLLIVVPLALGLIFALLYLTYGRLSDVLIVFSGVPLASVGGILALWLRDLPFSISAGVGFIALSGVSVLNSMVLVSFIRQLREQGVPLQSAIVEAALTRLRPVLMTALVASLGFVPMALSTGVGAEVQRPLATVVIGGVISSTLLTLLVLPILYNLFGPRSEPGERASAP